MDVGDASDVAATMETRRCVKLRSTVEKCQIYDVVISFLLHDD